MFPLLDKMGNKMKKIIFFLVFVAIVDFLMESKEVSIMDSKDVPIECDSSTIVTGEKYGILASKVNVRKGAGITFDKVKNEKAANISVKKNNLVFEECTKNGWSWIRVLEPENLELSHRGWVKSTFLDKYTGKIDSYIFSPYTKKGYPKTIRKYGSRLKEIEHFRIKAAKMAIDSGKCDFVTMSELSDRSTLKHLKFWTDCRNGQRIRLDEFEIKKEASVLTEKEKSWDRASALSACKKAIKQRSLIPSNLDFHEIFGTSFYKAPRTHNAVLKMDFDAKNAFGVEIPYKAVCNFSPGEVGTIKIEARK